jgi:hypothetical protein
MFDKTSDFKKNFYINISVIVAMIVVFVSFSVLLRLSINHQISVTNDIKTKRGFVTDSSLNLSLLVKQWNFVKDYTQQVSSLVPSKDNLVTFSKDINAIAQKNGVSLTFNFGTEGGTATTGVLGSISFSATADGPVNGILSFLRDVEGKYYSFKINILDMSKRSDTMSRLSISGQVFYSNN